jgi:chromosome segregation ATPase
MIPAVALALSTLVLAAAQPDAGSGSACWSDRPSGNDRVIQEKFGGLRVCMVAEDAGAWTSGERPSQWPERARRVVLESRRGNDVKRLEIAPDGTGRRISWQVGRANRTFDTAAQQWRDRMLALMDTTWEIARLRGEVSGLAGEISSIRGEESSLRGEIASLRGDISSMREKQASIRRDDSKLRKEVEAVRGRVGSLQESIWWARSRKSALEVGGSRPDAFRDQIDRYELEIARLERELKDAEVYGREQAVWRRINALDADRKVDAIEAEIKKFDLDGKVKAIEKQIAALDVAGKTAAIEKQIDALDTDRRVRQLGERRDEELKRLAAAIAAIR